MPDDPAWDRDPAHDGPELLRHVPERVCSRLWHQGWPDHPTAADKQRAQRSQHDHSGAQHAAAPDLQAYKRRCQAKATLPRRALSNQARAGRVPNPGHLPLQGFVGCL